MISKPHSCWTCRAQSFSQGFKYDRTFVDGSPHQIHLRTTISHATRITRELRPGFSKEGRIRNGSQEAPSHYSGFMENVCPSHSAASRHMVTSLICSWLRQEHTLVCAPFTFFLTKIESFVFLQFDNHRRCENHVQFRPSLNGIFLFRFPRNQQTTLA